MGGDLDTCDTLLVGGEGGGTVIDLRISALEVGDGLSGFSVCDTDFAATDCGAGFVATGGAMFGVLAEAPLGLSRCSSSRVRSALHPSSLLPPPSGRVGGGAGGGIRLGLFALRRTGVGWEEASLLSLSSDFLGVREGLVLGAVAVESSLACDKALC